MQMTNFWKITAAIAILVLGILVGKAIWGCVESPNASNIQNEARNKIDRQKDSIALLDEKIANLQKNSDQLREYLDSLNGAYYEIRKKDIISHDSIMTELNKKGNNEFGGNGIGTTSALLYGNQFADNYSLQKKQLANQKAQIVAQNGIIVHKDTIILVQELTIDKITKITKRERNRARIQGFLGGGIVVGLLVFLL